MLAVAQLIPTFQPISTNDIIIMILSFKGKTARDIYDGIDSRWARVMPVNLHDKARRLLDQINATQRIDTLAVPPGNRLERLSGGYAEHWSIRINRQWRIIFKWDAGHATQVEVIDYHD